MMVFLKTVTPDMVPPAALGGGVYALTTAGSLCYLVLGNEKALVIDTGFGKVDTYSAAKCVTELPLVLVNTHGHADHIGCDDQFDVVYCHEAEAERVRRKNCNLTFVSEGYIFDLGGRSLEVIELPGHSPGGIALLDRANRIIFTGDMVSDTVVFLPFDYSNTDDYIKSMDKLLSMSDSIDQICCCHGGSPVTLDVVDKLRTFATLIKDGKLEGEPIYLKSPDGEFNVKSYKYEGMTMNHP